MKKLLLLPVLIFIASCSKSDTTSDPVADFTIKTNRVAQSYWTVMQ